MSWEERLRRMVLAGGLLSFADCSGTGTHPIIDAAPDGAGGDAGVTVTVPDANVSFPCGNANPDPCICGRPDASTTAKAECDAERACVGAGGFYDPTTFTDARGVTTPAHCVNDAGADSADGDAGSADGGNG